MTLSRDRQSSFKKFIRVGASRCAERGVGGRSSGGRKGFPQSSEGCPLVHQHPSPRTEKRQLCSCPRGCITAPNSLANRTHPQFTQQLNSGIHQFCVWHPLGSIFVRRSLCCYLAGLSVTVQGDSCKMLAQQQSHSAWSVTISCLFLTGDYYSDSFEEIERKRYLGCEAGRCAQCSLWFQCAEVWVLVLIVGGAECGRGLSGWSCE